MKRLISLKENQNWAFEWHVFVIAGNWNERYLLRHAGEWVGVFIALLLLCNFVGEW